MKKTLLVLALAAIMVVAFVPSAFALHGAYNSTGASCAECHSVHDAVGGASQNLFFNGTGPFQQNTVANGATALGASTGAGLAGSVVNDNTEHLCEYCHVYGGHVIAQVYGSGLTGDSNTMASHAIGAGTLGGGAGAGYIPNSSAVAGFLKGNGAGGLGCVDCHNALPHAANSGKTWTQGSTSRLTMAAPDSTSTVNIYTQDVADAAHGNQVVNSFCARCHDKNMELNLGGKTHVLTTNTTMNTTNYGNNVTVAFGTSETCIKCHAVTEFHSLQKVAGQIIPVTGAIGSSTALVGGNSSGAAPFSTYATEATGTAFTAWGQGLGYGGGANKKVASEVADGLCIGCHMQTGGTAGVGVTF